MLICPNKNLKEWKDLVASVGENRAMLMWYESEGKVGFTLSAQTTILDNLSKVNNWFKQMKDTDAFWNKLQKDLQIPKDQISLLKESNGKTIEEKLTNFVVNYSYTVEINTAKAEPFIDRIEIDTYIYNNDVYIDAGFGYYKNGNIEITEQEYNEAKNKGKRKFEEKPIQNTSYYSNLSAPGGTGRNKYEGNPDWEYQELEFKTPLITPSIKGHAQFATEQGIGWVRVWYNKKTGVVEIQEIQSDLFQKGRDKNNLIQNPLIDDSLGLKPNQKVFDYWGNEQELENRIKKQEKYITDIQNRDEDSGFYRTLVSTYFNKNKEDKPNETKNQFIERIKNEIYEDTIKLKIDLKTLKELGSPKKYENQNQFLQLLNKDNNWVTFFIKSIIQDSAKKGYEKVLFPSGDTASKVEGHTTLEEFKKEKENRIKELEESKTKEEYNFTDDYGQTHTVKTDLEKINNEINQLKQELERVEGPEGFGALKPIYNFYENTVTNILNKTYGKDNVKVVTDEYGNTWNEVELSDDLLENFTIGSFKPRIPIPIPINNSLEELYREDVENSNNTCTFDIGK